MTKYKLLKDDEVITRCNELDTIVKEITENDYITLSLLSKEELSEGDLFILGKNKEKLSNYIKEVLTKFFNDEYSGKCFELNGCFNSDLNLIEDVGDLYVIEKIEDKIQVNITGEYTREELEEKIKELTEQLSKM